MSEYCNSLRRRLVLASFAVPALPGCSSPLPRLSAPASQRDARSLLSESAAAHGFAAFEKIGDLSVSYAGRWHPLVGKLQPELVDAGFRGGSEERYSLVDDLTGQSHAGASGTKQVVRHTVPHEHGDVRVWFNERESGDEVRRAAAALVVDGYTLFLMGPLVLNSSWASQRALIVETGGIERMTVRGESYSCDVLRMNMTPGLGFSAADRIDLFIDRKEHLMRKVRFTLNGLESTRGAVAEVDASDHATVGGVRWPTRFHEQLLRPLPLSVHDWRLTGLDVDRGFVRGDISGAHFGGRAAAPARVL